MDHGIKRAARPFIAVSSPPPLGASHLTEAAHMKLYEWTVCQPYQSPQIPSYTVMSVV